MKKPWTKNHYLSALWSNIMSDSKKLLLDVEILKYTPEMAKHFYTINAQWVSDMFYMEDYDEMVLSNPQKHIIDEGGQIWFARHEKLGVIGTCAVKNFGNKWYELTKMGVLESARGLKAGEKLLQQVLMDCRKIEMDTLFLLTNSICKAAIHLYEKNGFVHDKSIKEKFDQLYKRSDVFMRYTNLE